MVYITPHLKKLTGSLLYQLSFEATQLGAHQFVGLICSGEGLDGCVAKWDGNAGTGEVGTWVLEDVGTRGGGDLGMWGRADAGTQGHWD